MSFRRSDDEGPGGSRWRRAHRSRLLDCGLPVDIVDSDRALAYVLLHGDYPETGWSASWLSDEQAERLLELLVEAIPRRAGHVLIDALERRRDGRP